MGDELTLRTRMVNNQLRTFDVTDHGVQDAFMAVARENYVPDNQRALAYSDLTLTLSWDAAGRPLRTMTPPAVLARLIQLAGMGSDDVVLLVGSGLGYTAAILSNLVNVVIALECDEALTGGASLNLEADEIMNVVLETGPLEAGYPHEAPFDGIFVDGAVDEEPTKLLGQLKVGGKLVVVEGGGLSGRAKVCVNLEGGITTRYAFNASLQTLPGFERAPTFVF